MDCKHDIEADKEPTGFICKECLRRFEEKELVILTKAQHEARDDELSTRANTIVSLITEKGLMKDVVKAGRDLSEYFDHAWGNVSYHDMKKLKKALDALDKGNNERGL